MLHLPRPREARQRESTIALINIVFLMLIFFLLAGTLAPPLDPDVSLITTANAERGAEPPNALFVTDEGELRARGRDTSVEDFVGALRADGGPDGDTVPEVKVAADRALAAAELIDIVGALKAAGVEKVSIVTERTVE